MIAPVVGGIWHGDSMCRILSAVIAAPVVALPLAAGPAASAAPTCSPGDKHRQGYQCSLRGAVGATGPVLPASMDYLPVTSTLDDGLPRTGMTLATLAWDRLPVSGASAITWFNCSSVTPSVQRVGQ